MVVPIAILTILYGASILVLILTILQGRVYNAYCYPNNTLWGEYGSAYPNNTLGGEYGSAYCYPNNTLGGEYGSAYCYPNNTLGGEYGSAYCYPNNTSNSVPVCVQPFKVT